MQNESDSPIIAIDGGGTRCRVALLQGGACTVVESGSANIMTDFDRGTSEILLAVDQAFDSARLSKNKIRSAPAFVGLAGMTDPEMARRLQATLPFEHVCIRDDRPAALRGALRDTDGFLAHCGTGSFFMSRAGGRARGVGGWGPIISDHSSAQWIGRHALTRTVDAADGIEDHSPLTRELMGSYGSCARIARFASEASPSEFGDLAPLVTEHAKNGDKNALQLMQMGADQIVSILTRLGWVNGAPICLTGGIGPVYSEFLPPGMQIELTEPLGTPLDGAISLAQEFRREVARERC